MMPRRMVHAITALLVAGLSITGLARQGELQIDPKVAALIAAVQRELWPRQAEAIAALGATGDPRATEPLAALTREPCLVRP